MVRQLALNPIGVTNVGTAGGLQRQAMYPARFTFPGTPLPSIDFSQLLGANLTGQFAVGGPVIALLGRDILQHFVLIYNGPGASFALAV